MKKILITGKDSYIGTNVERYLVEKSYQVDTVDMRGNAWKEYDFSPYDAVFHVAGIAHVKETPENESLYYMINRDLAIKTAQKAKSDGVKQFVLMSSMSVYGMLTGEISKCTFEKPITHYGKAKLEADRYIQNMESEDFAVAVLRPPMVYGEGCKGNYSRLIKMVKVCPVFPDYDNERSMIHIKNLSWFIYKIIEEGKSGIFHPQNSEYVNTKEMVIALGKKYGKKIHLVKGFDYLIKRLPFKIFKKIFGDLKYEKDDICDEINFIDSIYKG